MRNDIHSPKNIDPAAYTYIKSFDANPPLVPLAGEPMDYFIELVKMHREEMSEIRGLIKDSPHPSITTCDHCGAYFRYGALYKHENGSYITVGHICAFETMGHDSRRDLEDARLRKMAATRREVAKAREARRLRRGELKSELYADADLRLAFSLRKESPFLLDVFRKRIIFGELSTRQIEAVKKAGKGIIARKEREAKEAELLETAPIITEGRYEFEGVVVSKRVDWSPYGDMPKMLVVSDSGNKLWGTVPRAIDNVEVGERVKLTGTVKRSDKDEHFGFFSRPAKASVVAEIDKAA